VVAAHTVDWRRDTDGVFSAVANELAIHFLRCCPTGRPYHFFPSGESERDKPNGGMAVSLLALESKATIYTAGITISQRDSIPTST
jgi:hypothetical protein